MQLSIDPNAIIAVLTGVSVALGGLSAAITQVSNGRVTALLKSLDEERETSRQKQARIKELEAEEDAYCDRIDILEAKIRDTQAELTSQVVRTAQNAFEQVQKMRTIMQAVEDGRLTNGKALSAMKIQVAELTASQEQTASQLRYVLAVNKDLSEQLEVLGYPNDPSRSAASLRSELMGKGLLPKC